MADNDINLNINIDASQAKSEAAKLNENLGSTLGNIGSSIKEHLSEPFKELGGEFPILGKAFSFFTNPVVIGIGTAVAAFEILKETLTEAVAEASKSEKILTSFNLALATTNEFTAANSKAFQDYADEIQRVTTFSSESVLQSITLGKNFGLLNDRAKEVTESAIKLAAATGKSLPEATEVLLQSLNGNVRALKLLGPEFAQLTEDQLKNGEALKLLNQRYPDLAEQLANNFTGAVTIAQNQYSEFLKELGKTITENRAIILAIQAVTDIIEEFVELIKENRESIATFFANSAILAVKFSADIILGVQFIIDVFHDLNYVLDITLNSFKLLADAASFSGLKKIKEDFDNLGKKSEFTEGINNLSEAVGKSHDRLDELIPEMQKAVDKGKLFGKTLDDQTGPARRFNENLGKIREEAKKFSDELLKGALEPLQKAALQRDQELIRIEEFEKKKGFTAKEANEAAKLVLEKYNREKDKIEKEQFDKDLAEVHKSIDEQRAAIEAATKDPIGFTIKHLTLDDDALSDIKNQIALALGSVDAILKGKQGAQDAVAAGLGQAFGAAFGEEFVPIATSIFKSLEGGPDVVKEQVKAFIEAVPDIVEAIGESMPILIDAIVDSLIYKGGAGRIGFAIGRAATVAMLETTGFPFLGRQWGIDFTRFTDKFIGDAVKKLGGEFADFLKSIPRSFSQGGQAIVKALTETLPDLLNKATVENFQKGAQAIYEAIKAAFAESYVLLRDSIISAFKVAKDLIFNGLNEGAAALRDKMYEPINTLINFFKGFAIGVPGAGGGAGTPGGIIAGAAEKIGIHFAQGGVAEVPPGYQGDNFPVNTKSGELIVQNDLAKQLADFLKNNAAGKGNDSSDVQLTLLNRIAQSLDKPINVVTTAQVNGKAFADISLQLSRNNARTAA